jgi:hypothetical protein
MSHYLPNLAGLNNFTTNKDIAQQLGVHYRHIPLHFSPTNVLLFKSRCNMFIGFGLIKELPGFVGSGTPYINEMYGSRSKIPSKKISALSVARKDLIPALKG